MAEYDPHAVGLAGKLFEPLDYPRRALWRGVSGLAEGDPKAAIPLGAGVLTGLLAALQSNPAIRAGAMPLGLAAGGGAYGLAQELDPDEFYNPGEDAGLLLRTIGDPLMWAGAGIGGVKGAGKLAEGIGAAREAMAADRAMLGAEAASGAAKGLGEAKSLRKPWIDPAEFLANSFPLRAPDVLTDAAKWRPYELPPNTLYGSNLSPPPSLASRRLPKSGKFQGDIAAELRDLNMGGRDLEGWVAPEVLAGRKPIDVIPQIENAPLPSPRQAVIPEEMTGSEALREKMRELANSGQGLTPATEVAGVPEQAARLLQKSEVAGMEPGLAAAPTAEELYLKQAAKAPAVVEETVTKVRKPRGKKKLAVVEEVSQTTEPVEVPHGSKALQDRLLAAIREIEGIEESSPIVGMSPAKLPGKAATEPALGEQFDIGINTLLDPAGADEVLTTVQQLARMGLGQEQKAQVVGAAGRGMSRAGIGPGTRAKILQKIDSLLR